MFIKLYDEVHRIKDEVGLKMAPPKLEDLLSLVWPYLTQWKNFLRSLIYWCPSAATNPVTRSKISS